MITKKSCDSIYDSNSNVVKNLSPFQRYSMSKGAINDICRAIRRSPIPAIREPVGLLRSDGRFWDGTTRIAWTRRNQMACDFTVPKISDKIRLNTTSTLPEAAASHTAKAKTFRYFLFTSMATEIAGSTNWETNHIRYRRSTRDNPSVPTNVHNHTKEKCSLLYEQL